MKKVILKIFNAVNALVIIFISVWLMFYSANETFADWTRRLIYDDLLRTYTSKFWVIIILWIFFVVGVSSIYMSFKKRGSTHGITSKTEVGECKITISALENIAMAEAKRIVGIKVYNVFVSRSLDGVNVQIKASAVMDENIPELQKTTQDRVKEALERTADVKVSEVNVIVTEVNVVNKPRVE